MPRAPPVMTATRSLRSSWFIHHLQQSRRYRMLRLNAEARNADAHGLPRLEKQGRPPSHSDAGRGAGGDHISRTQAHELADVRDEMCDPEYHRARIAALEAMAINLEPQIQSLRVRYFLFGDQPGANRRESVAALALVPLAAALELVSPLGYIVDYAVSGDVFESPFDRHILSRFADDDAKFDLPIRFLRAQWNLHIVIGSDDGAGRLHEQDRLGGNRHVGLGGMILVVQPHTDDLGHARHAWTDARRSGNFRQFRRILRAYPGQALRQQRLAADVGNDCR